jgi:Eco57I restriction-modification methylase
MMISIADAAFVRLFAFFDLYHWRLDPPTIRGRNMITPDVLGYIFEQYVNQQQMGAYYTKEDVTEYIARNTIIPYLFDALKMLPIPTFKQESSIWQLVRDDPNRYIQEMLSETNYLPGESVSEYTQRRQTYTELFHRLQNGQIQSIDDFITYNLQISRFACDVISTINEVTPLLACYRQLIQITILDPTCGSGAFLLAALQILFPLYEACLKRLEAMQHHPDSQRILAQFHQEHTNNRYGILKTIIIRNLYGVDLMEGAVEICKLRLLLKLIAQVEHIEDIEPFPNIDHNIYAGNALEELCTQEHLIEKDATNQELPHHFCWPAAFQPIREHGGFNVIIGNPPYVEYSETKFSYSLKHFITHPCANLYTCVVERSYHLLSPQGRHGMILPLAAFSTKNMQGFLSAFRTWFPVSWLSFYHFRPAMLFSGSKVASIPTTIYLTKVTGEEQRFSTSLLKWTQAQRPQMFESLLYHRVTAPRDPLNLHYYPKFGHTCENDILQKLLSHQTVKRYVSRHPNLNTMFYRSAGGLYWKIFVNFPWPYHTTSNKHCSFHEEFDRDVFVALFNSSLFWWYYTVTFDTFNLKDYMLFGFRFTYPEQPEIVQQLCMYSQQLMDDFRHYAKHLKRGQTGSYTIYARKSKSIIDAIDQVLAQHYHFSDDELDFILHYDCKYRMGTLSI